jgi:hypothetical protein
MELSSSSCLLFELRWEGIKRLALLSIVSIRCPEEALDFDGT